MRAAVYLFLLFISLSVKAQNRSDIIMLSNAFGDYMFQSRPPSDFTATLRTKVSPSMSQAASFIAQTITADNDLLDIKYLTLPDDTTLRSLSIINAVFQNSKKETTVTAERLIDSLMASGIDRNNLIDDYYRVLFAAVGNKIKSFNMSKVNFTPDEYQLRNATERGIFFLRAMDLCATMIWGYMNIVKPANTKEAVAYIKKFPKVDGRPYYTYTELHFLDFEFLMADSVQSYKNYYVDRYYGLLLNHLICIDAEKAKQQIVDDLLLASVLHDRSLYKYTHHRTVLEQIFYEVKRQTAVIFYSGSHKTLQPGFGHDCK